MSLRGVWLYILTGVVPGVLGLGAGPKGCKERPRELS